MAAAREGFLTDEQREVLKTASENTEMLLSSSPKTTPSWLSDQHIKAPAGERAGNAGIAVRHVRRTHSGKCIRVKKGIFLSIFSKLVCYLGGTRIWDCVLDCYN